jgi:Family of unknown function (DUF6869)
MIDREALVGAWIAHHTGRTRYEPPREESFWAWQALFDLTHQDPEAAWTITLDLIRAAPDDQVLADIASGPLEALIQYAHATLMDRVDTAARQDPKFRRCLTGVWLGTETPAVVRDRVSKYTSTVKNGLR